MVDIRVLIASIRLFAKQLESRQLGKLCQLLAGPGSCEDPIWLTLPGGAMRRAKPSILL